MAAVICARRHCKNAAAVATRTPRGEIDEHLCETCAWETVQVKAATLSRIMYLGTKRPFVAVNVSKAGAV